MLIMNTAKKNGRTELTQQKGFSMNANHTKRTESRVKHCNYKYKYAYDQ